MTPVHAIMIVIIRLWAAGSMISALMGIASFLSAYAHSKSNIDPQHYSWFASYSVWLLTGIGAWIYSPQLSRMVYKPRESEGVNIAVSAEHLVMIGSFLIGGYYLVGHIPQLCAELIVIFLERAKEDTSLTGQLGVIRPAPWGSRELISEGLIVIAALFMTFRPSMLARLFSALRIAGLAKIDKEE